MKLTLKQKAVIIEIIAIITYDMRPFELKPEMKLTGDLHYDSLDSVELVVQLEQKFKIVIDMMIVENWETVDDVLETVDKLLYP